MNFETAKKVKESFNYLLHYNYKQVAVVVNVFIAPGDSKRRTEYTKSIMDNAGKLPPLPDELKELDLGVFLHFKYIHGVGDDFKNIEWFLEKYPHMNNTGYTVIPE